MVGAKINKILKLLIILVICVEIMFTASNLLLNLTPVQHYTSGILETLYSHPLSVNKQNLSREDRKYIISNELKEQNDFIGVHFKRSSNDTADVNPLPLMSGVGFDDTYASKLITKTPLLNNTYSSSEETRSGFAYSTVSPIKNQPEPPVQKTNANILRKNESSSNQREETIWEKMVRQRFISRKKYLKKQCDAYGKKIPEEVALGDIQFFYYAKTYNLLACISAKGGSSTWKSHFLSMNGYDKPYGHPHVPKLHKWIKAKQVIGENFLAQLSGEKGVTRVISVRHPFSRLISAYTDKYNNGKPIILTKGRTMFYRIPLEMIGRNFTPNEVASFPFPLFLRFVLYQKSRRFDRHWVPYSRNCKPCGLSYDYVVFLETLEDDLAYIIQQLGIKEIDAKTHKHISGKGENQSFEDYFKDIPPDVIRDIYSIYKEDFRLFGYTVPQFVKDAFANSTLDI